MRSIIAVGLGVSLTVFAAEKAPADVVVAPEKPEGCEKRRETAKFDVEFHDVDVQTLMQTLADATCATFTLAAGTHAKVSINPGAKELPKITGEQLLKQVTDELAKQGVTVTHNKTGYRIAPAAR